MESLVDLVISDRPEVTSDPGDHLSNCPHDCSGDHTGDCSGDRSVDRPSDRLGEQLISPAHHKYYKSLLLSCQPQAKSFWAFFLQLPQFQVQILTSISRIHSKPINIRLIRTGSHP